MTVYDLYERNGDMAGFYVRCKTWGPGYAQVVSIGNRYRGALKTRDRGEVRLNMYNTDGELISRNERMPRRDIPFCELYRPGTEIVQRHMKNGEVGEQRAYHGTRG